MTEERTQNEIWIGDLKEANVLLDTVEGWELHSVVPAGPAEGGLPGELRYVLVKYLMA